MPARLLCALAFVLASLAAAPSVRADVLPPPTRPHWDEHPAPQPDPPPDEDAARRALAGLALVVLTLAGVASGRALRRRARVNA